MAPVNPDQPMSPSRPLSRRAFLKLAAATAAGAALTACDRVWRPGPTRPSSKAQLVYQDWSTEWFPPMAQQMLEEFHATHPNIRVYYVPDPPDLEVRMLADMQAGTAADVFQGCCAHFPIWAQKGYTLDLRPYVDADLDQATIADWDPVQYRSFFTPDGQQYGLPKYHGALGLYYNQNLFALHRVDMPDGSWTYDDYLEAMRRLTLDTDGDGQTDIWGSMVDISWDRIQVHVNSWGGHFVDPADSTRCTMDGPQALQALEWLRARMWDDKVMATLPRVQRLSTGSAFAAGRLAMVEDGSWALKPILTAADFLVGVAPFPAGPARHVTLTSTDGFGIYSGTKWPDAAWELIKFLISKDYGRAMAKASLLQPARLSLLEEWAGYVRAAFPGKALDLDVEAFADGHIKGYSVTAEVFADMAQAQRLAYDAWDSILTLGQAPISHMVNVCQQINLSQSANQGGGSCC